MCGITGAIWNDSAAAIPPDVLARMTDCLAHRGPDDRGEFRSDLRVRPPYPPTAGVALGHRRLSILDVAGGHQPLSNEDDTIWVVFNGEIFNFHELHQRLEGAGHTFRTRSDTETLVHLYEEEGPEFARRLVGMFALAIWDAKKNRLVLVRDRLGQKPLYYRREAHRLLFASELKSLWQVPGLPREIDPSALDAYLLYQYVPHPMTIFRGFHKLPPAHYAVWENGQFSVHRYWSPLGEAGGIRYDLSEDEAAERLRTTLTEAVRLRLQSEVPLGAFLSGGIDSSVIVALMQQLSSTPVKTFSIGFADPAYDERAKAAAVAKYLGTEHEELQVEPHTVDVLHKLVWHYDEPFADSSAVPTWYVSEMARRHVTVALTGDAGDELFIGYDRYRAVALGAWFDKLPSPLRRAIASSVWQRLPGGGRSRSFGNRLKRLLATLGRAPLPRYVEMIAYFNESRRAALYTDDFLAALPDRDPVDFLRDAWQMAAPVNDGTPRGAAAQAALADLVTYLPADLMTKVDIASMAHGLECRSPMLDHRVVELAVSLPPWMKLRGRRGKRILEKAFGPLLPPFVFQQPKRGFGIPQDRWFREDLHGFAREILLDDRTTSTGWFRREAIETMLNDHAAARAPHGERIWALLFLELWRREWFDG